MSSSSPRRSAASVGPKRSPSAPPYLLRIKLSTRRRSFSGLPRFDPRPALPCLRASAPRSPYRRPILQRQISLLDSPHHFHPLQLATAHRCPLQPASSWLEAQSKGTFLLSFAGDIIKEFQHDAATDGDVK